MKIGCQQVAEGMYTLMMERVFLVDKPEAKQEHEAEAVMLIQAVVKSDWQSWESGRIAAKQTASALWLSFFAEVSWPRQGKMLGKEWEVHSSTPVEQALEVVAFEIGRSHPPPVLRQ